MSMPTNEEMNSFYRSLEEIGPSVAERRLNQNIYGSNSWKIDESQRYIKDQSIKHEKDYQEAILSLQN